MLKQPIPCEFLVTSLDDAITSKTPDGLFTSWNTAAERIYGYSESEMLGKHVSTLIPSTHADEFLHILEEIKRGERIKHFETERKRKDGTLVDVSLTVSPINDSDGKLIGISTIGRDLTAQKQASQYARSLIEASLDPLVTISPDGKITDVNDATVKVTGVSRTELIGSDFFTYFTEPEKAREGYRQAFAQGFVADYPLTIRHRDGRLTDVLYNASVYKDTRGNVLGVFAAARDITVRKQAEKELRNSEQRYRALVTATTQIVWTTDAQGGVIDMPGWREFTGQTCEEVKGTAWITAVHPDDRDRTMAVWRDAVERRSLYDTEYRVRRHDGAYRHFSVRGVPVLETDGTIREWVGTCTDITERKRAEAAIRQLNEELEQRVADRTAQLEAANRELEAFAYSVSHDLRAPLRALDGFSQAVLEDYADKIDGQGQDYLQRIRAAAQRMGQLIDDILQLSRLTRGQLQRQAVDLTAMAADVAEELHKREPARAVETVLAPGLAAHGDPRLLRVVLDNLFGNAWKFTGRQAVARIELGALAGAGGPTFFVRDNGVGFDPQYAGKLFGAFQRLHSADEFPGTGIGLATVQRIVHRHGGKVWAESAVGRGATFFFTLHT